MVEAKKTSGGVVAGVPEAIGVDDVGGGEIAEELAVVLEHGGKLRPGEGEESGVGASDEEGGLVVGVAEDHGDMGGDGRRLRGEGVVRKGAAILDGAEVVCCADGGDELFHRNLARVADVLEVGGSEIEGFEYGRRGSGGRVREWWR